MVKLAAHLFDLLHRQGVNHAFGIPGDFALTLYDALAESPIEAIVMTHEPSAGFAADAYARMRGLGLAVVTYGVGGLNMVNAVAGAYAEKSPLVVVSGGPGVRERQERDLLHHKVKSFDSQRKIYEEVTLYAVTLDDPMMADLHIRRAIDYALTFKRPVYLEIPRDQVYADIPTLPHDLPTVKPTDPDALQEALGEMLLLLRSAQSPVILDDVDVHRFGLQAEVVAIAERLGVPVCSTMLGKSVFPEQHPQYIGIYNGEAGDPMVRDRVENSDCLILLGAVLSDINLGMFTAKIRPEQTIYISTDRIQIKHHEYHNIRFEDMVAALLAVEDLPKFDRSTIRPMQPRVAPDHDSVSMSGLIYELNQFINPETLIVTDVGDALFAADDLQTRSESSFLCPAFYASMGFGIPGMIGAQLADPTRRTIALVGDGAFQMTGMELLTAGRLGLNPIVIVMNNGSYTSLRSMGHEKAEFVKIAQIDYAEFARVLGGVGFVVKTAADLRQALGASQDCDRFSLIDVRLLPEDVSPALQRLGDLFAKTLKG